MNPEPLRQETFGYGYMWWVWDGSTAVGAYRGAYTARGAFGQFITVLPELDLVIAHKTDPDPATHPGWGIGFASAFLGSSPLLPGIAIRQCWMAWWRPGPRLLRISRG